MFQAVPNSTLSVKETTYDSASVNIKNFQVKQLREYKYRHQSVYSQLTINNNKVLLQNQKRQDRKVGKFTYNWLGPYTVVNMTKTGLRTLMNKKGKTLRKKYNVSLLKRIFSDKINQEVPNEIPVINSNQPHEIDCTPEAEEKPNGNLESKIDFEKLPDEIVENILVFATTITRQAHVPFNLLNIQYYSRTTKTENSP